MKAENRLIGNPVGENKIQFRLAISREQYERYYRGTAKEVIATALDGRKVRFPITALQPFVSHGGVSGLFQLIYNEDNRLVSVERLQ